MTYNYSATAYTCLNEFIDTAKIPFEEQAFVRSDFKLFYNFIHDLFEKNSFFKTPSKQLLENCLKELKKTNFLKVTTTDNSEAYLEYLKTKIVRVDKIINNQRRTMSFTTLTSELDLKKIFTSFRPNLIHSLDATYLRLILQKLPYGIITIHDSYGIDILSVKLLIRIANEVINKLGYNKKLPVQFFYSNNILL